MPFSESEENALYEAYLKAGDARLIVPPTSNAPSIDFSSGGDWRECRIWEGYLDASHILLKKALDDFPRANELVFPALFNLRHGMEVALKWHIRYAGGVIPNKAGHNLPALIEAFRRTADDLDDDATYIPYYVLERISELASIDPRSIMFRYSTEKDGSPVDINPKQWDLTRLYFSVSDLIVCLDDLSGKIDLSRDEEYQKFRRGE